MKKITECERAKEILTIDGSFGGNQEWFLETNSPYLRRVGCGVIAATNLLIYTSIIRDLDLFEKELNKENYLEFSLKVARALKPTPIGIPYAFQMNHGVKKFSRDRGITILPMRNSWTWSYESCIEYIVSAFIYNSPVLLLTWRSVNENFSYHWVMATKLEREDGKDLITVSSWGREYTIDFREFYDHFSLYKAIIFYL